jgi:excinuclease ABC subunit C
MPRTAQDGPNTRGLFAEPAFAGFGPSRFLPDGLPGEWHLANRKTTKLLRNAVREAVPKRPGVYGMLDKHNRIIYVGKAKNLRSRLLSYFRPASRHPKAGKIIGRTRRLVWEFAADELAALLRELELIRRYRPRYNVLGQPGRERYRYLCVGRGPAAYAYVTREPTGKEPACYGPFVGRDQLTAAARRLNDHFRLRDCSSTQSMRFAEDSGLFDDELAPGCLRHELGLCLGPCAGFTTRRACATAARSLRKFLDGDDDAILVQLRKEMADAAARQQYERAGAIRDRLAEVDWLAQRLATLRTSREQAAMVYSLVGPDGKPIWYLMNRGQVWAAVSEPTDAESRRRVRDLLEAVAASIPKVGRTCVDSVLLVSAWFRRRPDERARLRPAADVLAELHDPSP